MFAGCLMGIGRRFEPKIALTESRPERAPQTNAANRSRPLSSAISRSRPAWVPNLDAPLISGTMLLYPKDLSRFEQGGIFAAKVLNASKMGRQSRANNAQLGSWPKVPLWEVASAGLAGVISAIGKHYAV
jgi:hypothetical protein